MQLDTSTMLLLLCIGIIAYASYSAHKMKDEIYCSFRRKDKTVIYKWAKVKLGRIDFDNGWYYLDPRRTQLRMINSGIHNIIPIWGRCLDFRHDSSKPLNPDDFNNNWESPEARKALNKQEDIQAFAEGNRQAVVAGKMKQGLLQQLFPIIMIGGLVILGFFMYQNMQKVDMLGNGQNYIEQKLGQLTGGK